MSRHQRPPYHLQRLSQVDDARAEEADPHQGLERVSPRRDERWPQVVIVDRPETTREPFDVVRRVLAWLLLLLGIAAVALLILGTLSMITGIGDRVGDTLGGIWGAVERAGATVREEISDRLDPTRPPQEGLFQDTEFDELKRVAVGEAVGQTSEYRLTLLEIRKRSGASNPDEAQYAVVHQELQTPRERRIFGLLLSRDRGEVEHYLYKGESFRLGQEYYKANWVSVERQEIAIARYRNVDELTAPLKFEVD